MDCLFWVKGDPSPCHGIGVDFDHGSGGITGEAGYFQAVEAPGSNQYLRPVPVIHSAQDYLRWVVSFLSHHGPLKNRVALIARSGRQ